MLKLLALACTNLTQTQRNSLCSVNQPKMESQNNTDELNRYTMNYNYYANSHYFMKKSTHYQNFLSYFC